MEKITILGAGSWGTAVGMCLANAGHQVTLWTNDVEDFTTMRDTGYNARYLPDTPLPKNLVPSDDLQHALSASELILIGVPSHAFLSVMDQIPTPPAAGISWLTKGIDPDSNRLLSDCVMEKWGKDYPYAIISGPSFAREVAQQLPTTLVIASHHTEYAKRIQALFQQKFIRAYLSNDPVGVQICGAVKNILAIACGISDGLSFGTNAKGAIITRGLNEMSRLGIALGAQQETFMGLAGIGDLVLTCTDDQSRNRRFGLYLGAGKSLEEAEKLVGQVVEGKHNTDQVCTLSETHNVDMPLCHTMHAILNGKMTAQDAADQLMARPLKEE